MGADLRHLLYNGCQEQKSGLLSVSSRVNKDMLAADDSSYAKPAYLAKSAFSKLRPTSSDMPGEVKLMQVIFGFIQIAIQHRMTKETLIFTFSQEQPGSGQKKSCVAEMAWA